MGMDIHISINKDMNKGIGMDIHINKDMNKNMDMNILSNIKKDMKKNILDIKDINVEDEGLEGNMDGTVEHIDLEDVMEEDVNEKIRNEFFPLFPYFLHNIEC